jgi:hypothetical protein
MHFWLDARFQIYLTVGKNLLNVRTQLARFRIDDLKFFLDPNSKDVIAFLHRSKPIILILAVLASLGFALNGEHRGDKHIQKEPAPTASQAERNRSGDAASFFASAGDASAAAPLPLGKRTASPTAGFVDELVLRLIVICPRRRQMMVAPVLFIVGVKRQCHPTHDWEQQANSCRCQTE